MANEITLDSVSEKNSSPLEVLGIQDGSNDNLLDEMLKGGLKPSGRGVFSSFSDAKEESRNDLFNLEKPEASHTLPGEKEDPEDDEEEPAAKKEPAAEENDWFHSVNHEQSTLRQRQESFEQALLQERQQTQAALNQLLQQQQKAAEPEVDYEAYGFEDANQYKAYEQQLTQKIRAEVLQAQAPMLYQLAHDRFQGAMARAENDLEHFGKYFPKEKLNQFFTELTRKLPPQQLATINWEYEWANAYRAADYERLNQEFKAQSTKTKAATEKQEQKRETQKQGLKLVPKASSQGVSGRTGLNTEIEQLSPKLSFNQFGREFKKRYFS